MNQPDTGRDDFQTHVETRAMAGRGRVVRAGPTIVEEATMPTGEKQANLEGLDDDRKRRVMATAADLVAQGMGKDDALWQALKDETQHARQRPDDEVTSPDVSLAHPHGPEGESHGGRAGRDPLRFVEDSTPAGTNSFSRTRGAPKEDERDE